MHRIGATEHLRVLLPASTSTPRQLTAVSHRELKKSPRANALTANRRLPDEGLIGKMSRFPREMPEMKHQLCALLRTTSLPTIEGNKARCSSTSQNQQCTYHYRCRRQARQVALESRTDSTSGSEFSLHVETGEIIPKHPN